MMKTDLGLKKCTDLADILSDTLEGKYSPEGVDCELVVIYGNFTVKYLIDLLHEVADKTGAYSYSLRKNFTNFLLEISVGKNTKRIRTCTYPNHIKGVKYDGKRPNVGVFVKSNNIGSDDSDKMLKELYTGLTLCLTPTNPSLVLMEVSYETE